MTVAEARRHREELAGASDALSVRLRVLEEARPRIAARVDMEFSRLAAEGSPGTGAGEGVEGLALTVMLRASADAQDDLKGILRELDAINEAKARLRASLAQLKTTTARLAQRGQDQYVERADPIAQDLGVRAAGRQGRSIDSGPGLDAVLAVLLTAYAIELEGEVDAVRGATDGIAEATDEMRLRLQLAMDRRLRMLSTLGNIIKKISDTGNSLIQNVK